ncbi:MAG: polysaccharide deacetylase family protein [Gemmatimonadota bacterium]|nr:polysaccharide deacetylase family protein [Gemmatimonadota bacterium]
MSSLQQPVFSVDLEDWYHGIEFDPTVWHRFERRISKGADALLALLADAEVKATYFVLGIVAEEHPEVIAQIAAAGHEIGTHGMFHQKIYDMSPKLFARRLRRSIEAIEQVTGARPRGYRAPYFTITRRSLWALPILKDHGIEYDASIFPGSNWRYGIEGAPDEPFRLEGDGLGDGLVEFPVSTGVLLGKRLGVGGAYFRILPYHFTKGFVRARSAAGRSTGFYIHPWELDPSHPIVRFRLKAMATHYLGLGFTRWRLRRLLRDFSFVAYEDWLADLDPRGLPGHEFMTDQ